MKEISETHQHGFLTIEKDIGGSKICDVGIQVSKDGRIWICVNGQAFIRFKPLPMTINDEEELKHNPGLDLKNIVKIWRLLSKNYEKKGKALDHKPRLQESYLTEASVYDICADQLERKIKEGEKE